MKFFDELPSRVPESSRFANWLTSEELAVLKRRPGQWGLLREDLPQGEAQSAGNYMRTARGVDVALRRTTPEGNEYDLYVGWKARKKNEEEGA